MVIKEVPSWARWFVFMGIFIPAISFIFLKAYDPRENIWWNMMNQTSEFTFSKGQNPIICVNDTIRTIVGEPLGFKVPPRYECQRYTQIKFSKILLVCMIFLLGPGLYGYLRGEQRANTRPTDWKPFSQENVRKTEKPALRNESPEDSPIKPSEGGF